MSRTTIYRCQAPSNIALIKYWGKRQAELQWPANDSLSMTLSHCASTTNASIHDGPNHIFRYADRQNEDRTNAKAITHLEFLARKLGFEAPLKVISQNNFPSDCGIASSASGMAALTIAAVAAWTNARSLAELSTKGYDRNKLAHLARMGSGSAGRSLFGGFVKWTAGAAADAQNLQQVLPTDHWELADIIAVVSQAKKPRSSREAHADAWSSPLFAPRLAETNDRMRRTEAALTERNLEALGQLIEQEALEMHAVMMTAQNPANYLTQQTVMLLSWIREERYAGRFPAYFTLDAGPNVHIICEKKDAQIVIERLTATYPGVELIADHVGNGPNLTFAETDL